MSTPLALPPHFQEPKGWRWHSFTRENRTIRFGTVSPPDTIPDGVLVCLQGVREFAEKYYETAHWALAHNLAFWTFDWAGQGKSTRFLPHKRHTNGFDADLADLDYLINEYIKPSSVHPDRGRIPLIMLAHSMGANLGLRYIHTHPDVFTCAAFTAPMIGIKVFEHIPPPLATLATAFAGAIMGKSYVAGGRDWANTPPPEHERLSGDAVRSALHNAWGAANPDLITGDVTYKWLYEAQKSCTRLKPVSTPSLFGIPGHEHLVDNARARAFIAGMAGAKTLELPESYHEILMERDDIRGAFLAAFYALIKENVIDRPETLKRF